MAACDAASVHHMPAHRSGVHVSSVEYRIAAVGDASAIADVYAPYVRDTATSFETEAPDTAELAQRIERIGSQYPWLAASSEGRVIGYAYACENRSRRAYRWSVDTAVYLDVEAQRKGIGRELYRRLFALLRAQGYVNAFAGISLPNTASVGLHESMGFALIGVYRRVGYKLGAWHDVGWWQLVIAEGAENPHEPVRFSDLDRALVARVLAGAERRVGLSPPYEHCLFIGGDLAHRSPQSLTGKTSAPGSVLPITSTPFGGVNLNVSAASVGFRFHPLKRISVVFPS
jgi:L-amino acid N-acyltransferase YncA